MRDRERERERERAGPPDQRNNPSVSETSKKMYKKQENAKTNPKINSTCKRANQSRVGKA